MGNQNGFTLLELTITALAVTAVFVGAIIAVVYFVAKSF